MNEQQIDNKIDQQAQAIEKQASSSEAASYEKTILAIDTSTAAIAAALVRNGDVIGSVQAMAERNHSVLTVTKLKELLDSCGVHATELDAIAVGRGPGSYTGMRIAVTIGKTLAWTWKKLLVGVSSLEALAYGARQSAETAASDWFIPIMDARRGQVYTALFAAEPDGSWSRLAQDGIRLMHDWVDQVAGLYHTRQNQNGDQAQDQDQAQAQAQDQRSSQLSVRLWIVGDLSLHEAEGKRLNELLGGNVELRLTVMEGAAVAQLGAARLLRGEQDDVHSFVPNYTQLAEAEVKLLEKAREKKE